MGSIKRFVRKLTGRIPKADNGETAVSNVGVPRTVAVPAIQQAQSPGSAHPTISMLPSHPASTPGSAPIMTPPAVAPIQTVSPNRIPNGLSSTAPASEFSHENRCSTSDEQSSENCGKSPNHIGEPTKEDALQDQGFPAPLPQEDTINTIFHPATPPPVPRMTSSSFARLPEYFGSSETSEDFDVPRTRTRRFHSDLESAEISGMLRPLEFPAEQELSPSSEEFEVPRTGTGSFHSDFDITEASGMRQPLGISLQQEDVFTSSSSPDQPTGRNGFALPGPPSYHGRPLASRTTPLRPSHRTSSMQMPVGSTPLRVINSGSTRRGTGRALTHRRTITPYPVTVPQDRSSSLPSVREDEDEDPHLQPRVVHLPPRLQSSPLPQENSFFTRMEPLPSSTPILPRSDSVDLQRVLLSNPFVSDVGDYSSVRDGEEGDDEGSSDENWEEHGHARTPSEQAIFERAQGENASGFRENGQLTWWEVGSQNPSPERDPHDRSGARASCGFR